MSNESNLYKKYPPSKPCNCEICKNYCKRPGWWTVDQAESAINAGYANRMMLEISPEMDFGVISPAFRGCEGNIAVNTYSLNGCNFYKNSLCELHSTIHIPLECRFCHHERTGMGNKCHLDIERDWKTPKGQKLVKKWGDIVGLWEKLRVITGIDDSKEKVNSR